MPFKMSPFSTYVYKSRYSKWLESEGRREEWPETVKRYIDFFSPIIPKSVREETAAELEKAILHMDVMPSMRALMTAGPALQKSHVAAYNCSFIGIQDPRAFDEALFISMNGVGVGYSVESRFISQLPTIAEEFHSVDTVIRVADSRIGWASGLRQLLALLYTGAIPKWDLSNIRPKGAPLKTTGGRASGPDPLDRLFKFTVNLFQKAAGRKLHSIECHDLMCMIADCVVCGGHRRSALISLSDLNDDLMRNAKNGQWWEANGQRANCNNSAVYETRPDMETFLREMVTLVESKSGERGIFNRQAAKSSALKTGRRKWEEDFGGNPCLEVILKNEQYCNLSEVVIRANDNKSSIKRKVRIATIIGTLQSTLTDFPYIRKGWKKNCDEERLLGVSLTGIMDNKLTSTVGPELNSLLDGLREHAIEVNKEWAEKLKINQSVSITCTKPSGTVSSLVNSAPGIHPRYSQWYIRSVRDDRKSPVNKFLKACGVPHEPDKTKPEDVDVFYFPVESPEGCITRDQFNALQQLELYLAYKQHWCEHTVSNTIYVKDHEWLDVMAWVYKNFDSVCGLSFLPHTDFIYSQPPYEAVDEKKYKELVEKMPVIDWSKLKEFEKEDTTTSSKEIACSSGSCEIL